jgi:membrane associated rhomboid family serine protease
MTISLTLIIVLITVAASWYAWRDESVMSRWLFNPYRVQSRQEYGRFVTSGLIHADIGHLAFNMITFYSFGNIVEQTFQYLFGPTTGMVYFLLLYVLGVIVSDLPTFFKHRENPGYNSLGASGGVSSVVFVGILFYPLQKLYLFFIPIGIPGFIFGGLYMLYSFVESRRGRGYINHDAHLWGAIFGILFVVVLYPDVIPMFMRQLQTFALF